MKAISAQIVFWLSAFAIFSLLRCQDGPQPDCSDSNQFLRWLETVEKGIKRSMPDTNRPAAGWEICDTTWGTTGTCCDLTKLKSAFNKRITIIKDGWERFINGLRRFKAASAKLKSVKSSSLKTDIEAMLQESATYDLQGLTVEQATNLVNKMDNIDTDLSNFRTKATACFEATKKVRGAIYCNGCLNGNAFTGISQDVYFKFKSTTCNDVIKVCTPVWNYMYTVHAQLTVAVELTRKAKEIRGSQAEPPKLPKGLKFGDLAALFTACPTGEISTECTQLKLDAICGTFISFKNPETLAEYVSIPDLNTATKSRLLQNEPAETPQGSVQDGTGSVDPDGLSLNAETKPVTDSTSVDATNAGNESAFGNIISLALMAFLCESALIH